MKYAFFLIFIFFQNLAFAQNIEVLDCTLRDGGYYNNWDFSKELIEDYLEAMSAAKVEYVELGFRFFKNKF